MGKYVLKDAVVKLGADDISEYIKSITIEGSAGEADTTGMNADGDSEFMPALKSWTATLEANDDQAADKVADVLHTLWDAQTIFVLEVRPTSAVVGVDNPNYTGSAFITSTAFGGSIGDGAKVPANMRGTGKLERLTA